MDMKYLANNWVPHKLSTENKNNRVRICGELLAMHRNNDFLNQLVTGDELWLYWDNEGVGSRRRSWVAPGGDAPAVPKRTFTCRKHVGTVFWDAKGILLFDVLSKNTTMTAAYYCTILDKLKLSIQEKRRRLMGNGLMNNIFFAWQCASLHRSNYIWKTGWNWIPSTATSTLFSRFESLWFLSF